MGNKFSNTEMLGFRERSLRSSDGINIIAKSCSVNVYHDGHDGPRTSKTNSDGVIDSFADRVQSEGCQARLANPLGRKSSTKQIRTLVLA